MDMIQGRMDLAVQYGADVAIFIHNVVYWVEHNAANGKNYHDGRYWTYNSAEALSDIYPLWSRDQMKRLIKRCADLGLILMGDYNTDRRDRTKWYTPSDEILELYGLGKFALCKAQNRTLQSAESPNALGEIAPPLPSIYQSNTIPPYSPPTGDGEPPERKPEKKPERKRRRAAKSVPEWQPERFERFWKAYPRDEDRVGAVEQWDALPQDKALMEEYGNDEDRLLDEIARGLKRHLDSPEWKKNDGEFIPYAVRFLKKRRWKEKLKSGTQKAAVPPMPKLSYHIEMIDGEEMIVYDAAAP